MDRLDILEQKVLAAVTKIKEIDAERAEVKRKLDEKSAQLEALGLEKEYLLGEIEKLKALKTENERLRSGMETTRKRIETIISKIDAVEAETVEPSAGPGAAEPTEPAETTEAAEEETPGEEEPPEEPEGQESESIFG